MFFNRLDSFNQPDVPKQMHDNTEGFQSSLRKYSISLLGAEEPHIWF